LISAGLPWLAAPAAAESPTSASAPAPAASALAASAPAASAPAGTAPATAPAAPTAAEPFAFADFTWLNGNSRQTEFPLAGKVLSGQFTLDSNAVYSFARPSDHTLVGSTNSGRTGEIQVEQLGIGGDLNWKNVRGRFFTQFGMYSTMTPRNDASPGRGQWDLANAYRYISEGYGGYHWDTWHGINLDVGIFMSYVGLCSYYNYENWVYQMSYVSANTPWFFNGLRLQIFPTDKLKIELWGINGWQSYGAFNEMPGFGWQILWRPTGWFSFVTNEYFGNDTLRNESRKRLHSDTSVQVKYHDRRSSLLSKAAFSLTLDAGCESGGGVSCAGGSASSPSQYFLGAMMYNRLWFWQDRFGFTLGAGGILNPGRYLVLMPPINGATAFSGTPYFTANPGDSFKAWDASATLDYMPSQFITFRLEYIHRQANVPYFAGRGGVTPTGGNQGAPGSLVDGFTPDLSKSENRINAAIIVRL
jgi:hypothetical protein